MTDRDLWAAFESKWQEDERGPAPVPTGEPLCLVGELNLAMSTHRRLRRERAKTTAPRVRTRTARRPRERRDQSGRSSARSGDSGSDDGPPSDKPASAGASA